MKDLIRREDAIKAVEDGMCTFYDCYVLDRINAVPSTDRPTCEPKKVCIAQVHFDDEKLHEIVNEAVKKLKEEIKPKQGEWIDKGWHGDWRFEIDGRGNCWHEYECSECGFHKKGSKSNYCPDCGVRMKGAE